MQVRLPRFERFFKLLAHAAGANVFNPWTQSDHATDATGNGPRARRARLIAHFDTRAVRIMIGEAAGYQGCHVSGIPFTSERLVIAGVIPRVASDGARLSRRHIPWSEPSATTVWNSLHSLGIAHDTILWNAFPWHPHRRGELHSNRTPTRAECARGLEVLEALLEALPQVAILAVGRHAEAAVAATGRRCTALRHPSMGGATAFRRGLQAALAAAGIRYLTAKSG
jgi:uracil-DNA glycosylase